MSIYSTSSYKLIYIFTIPDKAHEGLVKIGDATIHTSKSYRELTPNCQDLREAADKGRIKTYTFTAGVKVDLHWAVLAVREKVDVYNDSRVVVLDSFRDHDVHAVLKNSGISCSYPNGIKNREWFACDVETAKRAIEAVINHQDFLPEKDKGTPATPTIQLRDEQSEAVAKTLTVFNHSDKMLWNCKMRFGKTLTAYDLIRQGNFQKTIVVTHRPVVEEGWREDHEKLFGKDSSHIFMRKQGYFYSEDYFDFDADTKNDTALRNAALRGDHFTYFASMQDLRGSKRVGGKFDKNKAVFDMDWDLIIYDEAHEGTQTELGQKVQNLLESPKKGKTPKVLELSGTPYNIMDKYEDNVYTWDYVKEQNAKAEWAYHHPTERNPYADMPRMNIFTFDMSKALPTSYRFETETSAFNFREFFRVWTGDAEKDFAPIPSDKNVGDFVHEEDVRSFLDIITKESKDTKYPFATDEYRKEFKHTFWMLPGVKEARALSALLKRHAVFSHYQIVNVAGEGDEELPYDNALTIVKEAIRDNPYTITLSCGKLTTGVTVKEWSAVMMLAGGATTDAKGYMQTIFRVQSAGVIDGKQKENCYVFDFAPDRALRVLSETHQLTKKGKNSDAQFKAELGQFLNYCPVYAVDGVQMNEYDVNSMMRQIKRISVDAAIKSGFEDDSIYKVETGIVMDDRDREFFEFLKNRLTAHKKSSQQKQVTMADNGLTQEEYDRAKKAEHKSQKDLTPEEREAREKYRAQQKERQKFIGLLRNIAIRLPLLIFGANVPLTEKITLDMFPSLVDDESWKEFLPEDITKEAFMRSIKYFDEDVLMGAGLRIRRLVKQADEYPVTERIKRITELFGHFRNPDKETVLTPWRVVNMHMSQTLGGYCFLNEQFDAQNPLDEPRYVNNGKVTTDVFRSNSKILEINSKSGVYPLYLAYSLYRNRLVKPEEKMTLEEQNAVWAEVLRDNLFILCKTRMAEFITRRTLAGFGDTPINSHYQPYLVEHLRTDMSWVVKKINNPSIWGKEGTEMKFDAIVGNPPYQIVDGGHGSSSIAIYGKFVLCAEDCEPNYVSMIMPSRWFSGGKGLDDFRNTMINDHHIRVLHDYMLAGDCFPSVQIEGGVCYFLWDKNNEGVCDITTHLQNGQTTNSQRYLNEHNTDIFVRDETALSILMKVQKLKESSFGDFVLPRNPFGISYVDEAYITETFVNGGYKVLGRFNNKREIKNVSPAFSVDKNTEIIDCWKVFISKADGAAGQIGNPIPARIIGKAEIGEPRMVCSETFLAIGPFVSEVEAANVVKYMKTKFFRFLVGVRKNKNMTRDTYNYAPVQDFSQNITIDWGAPLSRIDQQLYKKYSLAPAEIAYIEKMITVME